MNNVTICGLYILDYLSLRTQADIEKHGEIWVLNDLYQFIPQVVTPSQVWNIHKRPWINQTKGRFTGNWKEEYRKSGAKIIVIDEIDGLDNQELLDTKSLEARFPVEFLSCSICIMMLTAYQQGAKKITLVGMKLVDDEYTAQVGGILKVVEYLKVKGVDINWIPNSRYSEFITKLVDWSNIKSGVTPYWRL